MTEEDDVDDPGELDEEVERRLRARDPKDLPWVRERLRAETARRKAAGGGCGDTLYALCFLIYLIGEAEDAALVHAAKYANFDCGCLIDRGLLTMRRDLEQLKAALDPTAHAKLFEDLQSVFESPDTEPTELEHALQRYFGIERDSAPDTRA